MKKWICCMLSIPLMLFTSSCSRGEKESIPEDKDKEDEIDESTLTPVDVVIISGQSNAVGCTKNIYLPDSLGIDKFLEYSSGYEDIKIAYNCWTKDWPSTGGVTFYPQNSSRGNGFVPVKLGQGNGTQTFGPEIGIAEALHEKYANKLFLIKFACGASNLKDDWLEKDSPMYGRFIDYVRLQMDNLKELGYKGTIKAFCWMQGEGDSYTGYYQYYQDNLRTFVSNVRADLYDLAGNKDIPFIDAGINESKMWDHPEPVNEAKRAFAAESENNFYIDTMAEEGMHTNLEPPDTPDEYHYDSDSEVLLGHLFAEAFEQFLEK